MALLLASFLASDLGDPDFRAITTSKQVMALGLYAESILSDKAPWEIYAKSIKQRNRKQIDAKRTKDLLVNAWNTERLLHITQEQFSGNKDGSVAQWAFPQAYYAAFNSTLAFFEVAGHTETSHSGVRKKIGLLASQSKLGPGLNVYSGGGMKLNMQVYGLDANCSNFKSASLNRSDPENIKRHVISNYKNTREVFLKDQNQKDPIKTAKKEPKKRLTSRDWEKVSNSIGKTSWLCLLYRKRIKSNYRDIDTFLSEDMDLSGILNGLCSFINAYCLMCELHVAKQLGVEVLSEWHGKSNTPQTERLERIKIITK